MVRADDQRQELERIGAFAAEIAADAGAAVSAALHAPFAVRFKRAGTADVRASDPVSEIDLAIERSLREAIRTRFPDHGILGEELAAEVADPEGYVWAIDPIDGTTNFIHHFPLVAVSIACLRGGRPIAGAVWCSATHEHAPGVYHAVEGGVLQFAGRPHVGRERVPRSGRGLVATPVGGRDASAHYDVRTSGSAAIDCAFVAAGILRCARLARLYVWDVAGGLALIHAAGGRAVVEQDGEWAPFSRFEPPYGAWHRSLMVGDDADLRILRELRPRPSSG